jgi:ribosomal-protein-alanine N-acetyltransferase
MELRFEPVHPAAAVLLAALHAACFREDPWDAAAMAALIAMPGCFGRIACQDEAPVGFAIALDLGGECEILSLGVVPKRRRRGAGRALLDDLCDAARGRGAKSVVLEVAADNAAGRALYERAGFVFVGRRRCYYRRSTAAVDALVLRLVFATLPLST